MGRFCKLLANIANKINFETFSPNVYHNRLPKCPARPGISPPSLGWRPQNGNSALSIHSVSRIRANSWVSWPQNGKTSRYLHFVSRRTSLCHEGIRPNWLVPAQKGSWLPVERVPSNKRDRAKSFMNQLICYCISLTKFSKVLSKILKST